MTLPARVVQAVRPQASSGVLAGAAVVAAVFSATPFLLPDVSTQLDVPVGLTGLLSTAQVGSFALAAFLAGRLFRPRRRLHYGGLLLIVLANLAASLATDLSVLIVTRLVAGLGMGTLTWIAWADATRFSRGLGDVAAVGPVTAAVSSPIIGWVIVQGGYQRVYLVLGIAAAAAVVLPVDFGELPRIGRRVSSSRSNRILLGALAVMTLGGSAVFVFSAATAQAIQGLTPVAVSWALSLNALTGVVATRFDARRGQAGVWLLGTSVSALSIGIVSSQPVFFLMMALWGYAFWMAVPAVFRLLAERSLTPSERVGDAQAIMAIGRVVGPVIGGLAIGAGDYARLSIVGALAMGLSAFTVAGVEMARRRVA